MTDDELKLMFEKLKSPFAPTDIEWRIQGTPREYSGDYKAMILPYITNRAVMDRLDSVVGHQNWKNEFSAGPIGGVMCGLSIRVDGEWITKHDGADQTDVEAIKGGYSDAMKRVAVEWGIGRYLYNLPKYFVKVEKKGEKTYTIPDSSIPHFPDWALPIEWVENKTSLARPWPA
jgi:hypothetical protein